MAMMIRMGLHRSALPQRTSILYKRFPIGYVCQYSTGLSANEKEPSTTEDNKQLLLNTVTEYSHRGFKVNDRFYLGPVVVFPKHVLSWKVNGWQDMNPDALSVFTLTVPKPEIVVLGLGSKIQSPMADVCRWFSEQGIGVEVCDTRMACQQFNFLVEDGWRQVAAALLPMDPPATE